jgi:hypothetical protein
MQPSTVALIGAGVAVIGTLGGVVIGQQMSKNAQKDQWRRDNVRQECRELLGQLSVTLFAFIDWANAVRFEAHHAKASENAVAVTQQYNKAVVNLHRNFGSRLLIANEIINAKIAARWQSEVIDPYLADYNDGKLDIAYQALVAEIVEIGLKA